MARFLLLPLLLAAGCSSVPPLLFPLEDATSGRLDRITVWSQPRKEKRWELARTQGTLGPDALSSHLRYGTVPAGMAQVFPVDGVAPAPLDDVRYLLVKTEYVPADGSAHPIPPALRWFWMGPDGCKEVEDPGPTFTPPPTPTAKPRHHKGN